MTIRPYVHDIRLCVPPTSEWMDTNVPRLLAMFPECTTLRLTDLWEIFRQLEGQRQLERYFCESPPRSSLVARLRRRAFGSTLFGRRQKLVADSPLAAAADDDSVPASTLLAKLHTLHLDFPQQNLPILTFLAPASLHTLVLALNVMPHDPAAAILHPTLRAAGAATLRTLVLRLPWDLRLERPSSSLSMQGLRTVHLYALLHLTTPWHVMNRFTSVKMRAECAWPRGASGRD
ncbi:hypothetical protein C8R45DRAFT_1000937 [Mycena sanguinolenta]|nr:hypothetical protein C8R45DRAFT_1000937 [Mycena sanguinolenta]